MHVYVLLICKIFVGNNFDYAVYSEEFKEQQCNFFALNYSDENYLTK
jgi:uncharacterized membrane protein